MNDHNAAMTDTTPLDTSDRKLQALLKSLMNLGARYPRYEYRKFRLRYRSHIMTCLNGNVITCEPGLKLHEYDVSPEIERAPEASELKPNNDDEARIIKAYDDLVRRRYEEDVAREESEYQQHTMMIEFSDTGNDDDEDGDEEDGNDWSGARFLEKALDKNGFARQPEVEPTYKGFYVVFYGE